MQKIWQRSWWVYGYPVDLSSQSIKIFKNTEYLLELVG